MAEISEDSALISAGILAEFSFFSACIEKSVACLNLLCLWLLSSGLESAECFVGAQEHPRETRFLSVLLAVLAVTLNSGYSEHLSSVTFFRKHTWLSSSSLHISLSDISPTSCCPILHSAGHCQPSQGSSWTIKNSHCSCCVPPLELEAKQLCVDRLVLPQWGNKMFAFDYVSCLSELL